MQRTFCLDRFDREAASTIIEFLEKSDASLRAAQVRVLGGAMARVPVEATAFAHRQRRILGVVVNFHDNTAEDVAQRQSWANEFKAALQPSDDAGYVNFLGNEGHARVRAAYPGETWDRLVDVKRRYDPGNLFRLNQNIPPEG